MAVPACQGMTMWGLTDDETWLDSFAPFDAFAPNLPRLFDAARQPKPAYAAVRDAVAARAVPFAEQARGLKRAYREAHRLGTFAHPGGTTVVRAGSRAHGRDVIRLGRTSCGGDDRPVETVTMCADVLRPNSRCRETPS